MITIKQIYDAYPHSDLLAIEVTEETTLADIEALGDKLGDTLFLFICREIGSIRDECDRDDVRVRLRRAILDLYTVRAVLAPDFEEADCANRSRVIATQIRSILRLNLGESVAVAVGGAVLYIQRLSDGDFRVGEDTSAMQAVGNAHGALTAYLRHVFAARELLSIYDA